MEQFDLDKEWTEILTKVTEEVTLEKLQENIKQITKIAEHGKTTGLYKHTADKSKEYGVDKSAVQCFKDMVYKVATAPTQIHAKGAVFLIMPIIADKLNEGSDKLHKSCMVCPSIVNVRRYKTLSKGLVLNPGDGYVDYCEIHARETGHKLNEGRPLNKDEGSD